MLPVLINVHVGDNCFIAVQHFCEALLNVSVVNRPDHTYNPGRFSQNNRCMIEPGRGSAVGYAARLDSHQKIGRRMDRSLSRVAHAVRGRVLEVIHESGASHLGTSLSVVDVLVGMYSSVDLRKIRNHDLDRDRIILSKGHGAAALYCVMEAFSLISPGELDAYHRPGSKMTGHVSHKVERVEHSTGALGHGLSVALGMAIALRNIGSKSRVLCVVGDGEIQEGSVWEAVMLWRHLALRNLVLLVDDNQISSITETHKVIDMLPLESRFRGFGLRCVTVDGHRPEGVRDAISQSARHQKPTVIVCKTLKGKGVSFAEAEPIWHYRTVSKDDYFRGLDDLEREESELAQPDF